MDPSKSSNLGTKTIHKKSSKLSHKNCLHKKEWGMGVTITQNKEKGVWDSYSMTEKKAILGLAKKKRPWKVWSNNSRISKGQLYYSVLYSMKKMTDKWGSWKQNGTPEKWLI